MPRQSDVVPTLLVLNDDGYGYRPATEAEIRANGYRPLDDREIMCVHTNRASAALTAPPTAQEVES